MLYYYALLYYNINLKQIKTMKKIHLISTLIGLLVFSTISKADLKVVTSIKPIHSLASYIMDGVGSPGLIVDGYNTGARRTRVVLPDPPSRPERAPCRCRGECGRSV